MSVIRLQEMTPQIYTEESRDFQLLSRLYDSVFNGLKFDTDSILDLIDTKECRTSVLQLLQTKLGFFTERKIDDEKLRSILECFPILVRNKGSLRAIKETLYLFLRMYSVSSNMEIYYLPTPYSPPFSEAEPCILANGKKPENNSLIIRIHSFETRPDTSVMEEIFRYILPAGINYYIEFDKGTALQDIVLKSEDSAELTFLSDNLSANLRGSDQSGVYKLGAANTGSIISDDSYVSNRFIGYYGDEQSADDYLATLVDKIYSTAIVNYPAVGEVTGPIVSFDDAEAGEPVNSLVCTINPEQDLHGYDNPWPAGGGKNILLNVGETTTFQHIDISYDENEETWTINGTLDTMGNIPLAKINPTLMTWDVGETYTLSCRVVSGSWTLAGDSGITYAVSIFDSANSSFIRGDTTKTQSELNGYSGTGIAFDSTGNYQLMLQCWRIGTVFNNLKIKIQIEAGSSATAWTPYSNICPISGFSGLNVYRTSKNLLNPTLYVGCSYNPSIGETFDTTLDSTQFTDNHDGTFSFTTSSTWSHHCFLIPCAGFPKFHIKMRGSSTGTLGRTVGYLDKNFKVLSKINITDASWDYEENFVPSNDPAREYVYILITNRGTASVTITITEPQAEIGDTATSYSPYTGITFLVSWQSGAGTVYAGYLSIDKDGNVTLTATYAGVDMGTLTYHLHSNTSARQGWQIVGSGSIVAPASSTDDNIHAVSSEFKSLSYNATWTPYIIAPQNPNGTGVIVTFPTSAYSTGEEVATALDGVQLVYELKEPVTYTLSSVTVPSTVQGENNWWHDANGNITVSYDRDSTCKALICTAYSSNTPTWHRINFLGNLTTEEVSTQGGIVSALQAKGITVNNGDLIKYNNLYLLRVNNDWQECNYARYILNTYHLTE